MPRVTVARRIDAPLERLWASWDDFGDIAKFNPNLRRSFLIGPKQHTGQGAERQCDLTDGKTYLRERITVYDPMRRMEVAIHDSNMPLRDPRAVLAFRALSPTQSEVTMTMHFRPPFGVVGYLMLPLMKPQMRGLLGKLLDGNKAYVERGETVARAA